MTVRSRVVTYTQPGLPHVPRPVHPVLTRHDPLGCFYCFINFKKKIRTLPNILEHHGLNIKQEKISILYFFFFWFLLTKVPIFLTQFTQHLKHPGRNTQVSKDNTKKKMNLQDAQLYLPVKMVGQPQIIK